MEFFSLKSESAKDEIPPIKPVVVSSILLLIKSNRAIVSWIRMASHLLLIPSYVLHGAEASKYLQTT